jgi:hypothetical protein
MFQQVTPSCGYILQPPASGRLGIALSLVEECCGSLLIESDTGLRAVPQRVVFASAALNHRPGSTVCHQAIMLLFGLNSNHRIVPPATGSEVLALPS